MPQFQGQRGSTWTYDPKTDLGPRGGFGSVHPGEGADGMPVAVKAIPKRMRDGSRLPTRLRDREAEIAHRLEGVPADYLTRILDVGELGQSLLIVMERANRSLASVIGNGLPEPEVISILGDVARGLHDLHSAGIIHRDLKPGNVLDFEGRWKLSDFGIAHDTDVGTQTYTFSGAGTFTYMAPELWRLEAATTKTDLYALGCLAFAALTGSPPYRGTQDELRQQHLQMPLPPLETESPTLRDIILRLLNKDPSERPQDARAVFERLERIATPLSPLQESLINASARHGEERAIEAAQQAGEEALERERQARQQAAIRDLHEIIRDGVDLIQAALPEVRLRVDRGAHVIMNDDASLLVAVWNHPFEQDDQMVLCGPVRAHNRRAPSNPPLANVVAEVVGDRIVWKVYRFRASGIARRYDYGPTSRTHGMEETVFQDNQQRAFMLEPVTHVWSVSKEVFSPEQVVALFREAMEL